MITWNTSKEDLALLEKIAIRASELAHYFHQRYTLRDAFKDVQLAHEARPLDLEGLLNATDFNFSHDVFGIRRHIDRATGKMENCFLPRYTRGEVKE